MQVEQAAPEYAETAQVCGRHVVCFDMESDARYSERGVQDLVCMAYSVAPGHAALVGVDKAVDLWTDWILDDSVTLLGHSVHNDLAVLAQAAYYKAEGRHCVPGQGWAYELVFRAYDAGRIACTEIRQRLIQVRYGPHKAKVGLSDVAKRLFDVDLGGKKIADDIQTTLNSGLAWEDWPKDLLERTPWRVKYGSIAHLPIDHYPQEAQDYPIADVVWPRRVHARQSELWGDAEILIDEQRQTRAAWDLHLLSVPGWKADREWARRVKGLYGDMRGHCRKRMISDGIIKQNVVYAGKANERVDESKTAAKVKALVYQALGDETPITEKPFLVTQAEGRDPTREERFQHAQTGGKILARAIVRRGATVRGVVDAIDVAREGFDTFDAWLEESNAPQLNSIKLESYARKYLEFLNNLDSDRRIRTTYQTVVDTGRVASRATNIQQLPRDMGKPLELSIRGCVVPDPGWALVIADYEQLELCALAHILSRFVQMHTGDKTYQSSLARAINEGKDCHCMMAATLLSAPYEQVIALKRSADEKKKAKVPLTPDEIAVVEHRQISKAANFGFPGGQGIHTFIEYAAGYGLTLTFDQSRRASRAFRKMWVEMALYFRIIKHMVKRGGGRTSIVQFFSGRVRGGCTYTQAANGLFQALAADGAKVALKLINEAAYRIGSSPLYGTRPSGFVHDEFLILARLEQAERALPELERCMVAGMRQVIPDVKISAPGKIVTTRWSR